MIDILTWAVILKELSVTNVAGQALSGIWWSNTILIQLPSKDFAQAAIYSWVLRIIVTAAMLSWSKTANRSGINKDPHYQTSLVNGGLFL